MWAWAGGPGSLQQPSGQPVMTEPRDEAPCVIPSPWLSSLGTKELLHVLGRGESPPYSRGKQRDPEGDDDSQADMRSGGAVREQ